MEAGWAGAGRGRGRGSKVQKDEQQCDRPAQAGGHDPVVVEGEAVVQVVDLREVRPGRGQGRGRGRGRGEGGGHTKARSSAAKIRGLPRGTSQGDEHDVPITYYKLYVDSS